MGKAINVLIVEDAESDALILVRHLKRGGFDPVSERVETAGAMSASLGSKQWDVIVCDHQLPSKAYP